MLIHHDLHFLRVTPQNPLGRHANSLSSSKDSDSVSEVSTWSLAVDRWELIGC